MFSGRREGDVRGACEDVVTMFEGLTLSPQIQRAINDHLHTLFPESLPSSTFAVRSSAAGQYNVYIVHTPRGGSFVVYIVNSDFDKLDLSWN